MVSGVYGNRHVVARVVRRLHSGVARVVRRRRIPPSGRRAAVGNDGECTGIEDPVARDRATHDDGQDEAKDA